MKLRGHGNGVAIALAGLAVVIAMSGTAVAVTATAVNIADPSSPARVAKVDQKGRLSVATPQSSFNSLLYVRMGVNVLTSPTTATMSLTRVNIINNAINANYDNTNFRLHLVQLTVSAAGTCADGTQGPLLTADRVPVGAQVQDLYDAPLVFAPVAGRAYCIGAVLVVEVGGAPSTYYYPQVQLTGYVTAGTYTPSAKAQAAAAGVTATAVPRFDSTHPTAPGLAPAE